MKAEILSRTDWLTFPLIAVVLFTVMFVLTLFWIYRPGAKKFYEEASRLVLDKGDSP